MVVVGGGCQIILETGPKQCFGKQVHYLLCYTCSVENTMNLSNNDIPAYLIILQVIDKNDNVLRH